jgi:hypothetical protein
LAETCAPNQTARLRRNTKSTKEKKKKNNKKEEREFYVPSRRSDVHTLSFVGTPLEIFFENSKSVRARAK